MKKNILSAVLALFALVVFSAAPSFAATPLVNAQWVKDNLAKPDVVFLDVRGSAGAFRAGHIPGAVFTSYGPKKWRVEIKGTSKNTPSKL